MKWGMHCASARQKLACHPERSSRRAKVGGNGVEGSRQFPLAPTAGRDRRDPSTALRPPFHLRSAQDDTVIERFIPLQKSPPRVWYLRLTAILLLGAFALLPLRVFAVGAGVAPEKKQKEMEEAVAKAANSPNADLTQLQCGNLVYAGNKSSICFADKFLGDVARETTLKVGRNFVPVKLEAENVFDFPFCVWSGEQDFTLTKKEREHLRKYLLNGGFILSSPGCSDPNWDTALRRELKLIFPEGKLVKLPMSHPVFSTVKTITRLTDKHGQPAFIEGMEVNGRLVMIYSKDGLNDVSNAKGCCCCGGNMIVEAVLVNVNAMTYALLY